MASVNAHQRDRAVTRNGQSAEGVLTALDRYHEWAVRTFRYGLLNHPDVIERLQKLACLRDHWLTSRSPFDGCAYCLAIAQTEAQLDGHFTQHDLDRFASIIDERLALGVWGQIVPVNHGGDRYGRERSRNRQAPTTDAVIRGTVDAVARQLNPRRRYPNNGPSASTRRQWRYRMRRLADS